MSRRRIQGTTLLEMILAAALFLLVSGVLFKVVHQMTIWRKSEVSRRDQQSGYLIGARHIAKVLSEMPLSSISALYPSGAPTGEDLVLTGVTSRDGQGQWQEANFAPIDGQYQILSLDTANGQLQSRHHTPPGPPPFSSLLGHAQLNIALAQPSSRILGRGVQGFVLIHPITGVATDQVTSTLKFRVTQSGIGSSGSRSATKSVFFVR